MKRPVYRQLLTPKTLVLAFLAATLLVLLSLAPVEPVARAAPQASGAQDEETELERFEPSEDVPIDSSVSFPVDI